MRNLGRTLRQIWRLALPYWTKSEDRWQARLLLVADLALMSLLVMAMVRFNRWYADWTNAFVQVNYPLWKQQLVLFLVIAAVLVFAGAFKGYIEGWIAVKWRRWMTSRYLDNWMSNHNHYKMRLIGSPTDNPDQRIQEDINQFIGSAIMYSLTLLYNVVLLYSFLSPPRRVKECV